MPWASSWSTTSPARWAFLDTLDDRLQDSFQNIVRWNEQISKHAEKE